MAIQLKRAYDPPSPEDGLRILVERLWPRGVRKDQAAIDLWLKELAPSTGLRRWFGHDPARWEEFRLRYFAELTQHQAAIEALRERIANATVTFVFAAKEQRFNNAVALKEFLEDRVEPVQGSAR